VGTRQEMRLLAASCTAALAIALTCAVAATAYGAANGRIAYSASGGGQVFSIGPRGGRPTQLTHDPTGAAHPDWSRDGRLLAFDIGGRQLAVTAADGSGQRTVPVSVNAIDPSWSPNSAQLAFTGVEYDQNGNPETASLYVTNADGSNYVRIGPGSEPAWSPRGDWIAYLSNPARTDGCAGIWRMHSDGTGNAPVIPAFAKGAGCTGGGFDPSFAPNGRRIAYVSADGRSIFTAGLSGRGRHRVVRDSRAKASPVYSPDGRSIAYSTSGPGAGLWVVSAKGGKPKRISRGTGSVAWQPRPH
jgi:Tol biopolymer transport system component